MCTIHMRSIHPGTETLKAWIILNFLYYTRKIVHNFFALSSNASCNHPNKARSAAKGGLVGYLVLSLYRNPNALLPASLPEPLQAEKWSGPSQVPAADSVHRRGIRKARCRYDYEVVSSVTSDAHVDKAGVGRCTIWRFSDVQSSHLESLIARCKVR